MTMFFVTKFGGDSIVVMCESIAKFYAKKLPGTYYKITVPS